MALPQRVAPQQVARSRHRHVPWFVWVALIVAFFGGVFTVLLCAVAFIILVVIATVEWFGQGAGRNSPRT